MAIQTKSGSFAWPRVTGNLAITGLGFKPQFVIFFTGGLVAGKVGVHGMGLLGPGDASGTAGSLQDPSYTQGRNIDGGKSPQMHLAAASTSALVARDVAGRDPYAQAVSLDADGFTLNIAVELTDINSAYDDGATVTWLAVAGAANAYVTYLALGAPGATYTKTGVPFSPDALVGFMSRSQSETRTIAGTAKTVYRIDNLIGVATAAKQRCIASSSLSVGTTDSVPAEESTLLSDVLMRGCNQDGTISYDAALAAFTADGFSVRVDTDYVQSGATQGKRLFICVALKGSGLDFGSFLQPTATGPQSISTGGSPAGLMFLSGHSPQSRTRQPNSGRSLGMVGGAGSSVALSDFALDAVTPTQTAHDVAANQVINLLKDAAPTRAATASLTSLDPGGFTLDWSLADAVQREIFWIGFQNPGALSSLSTARTAAWDIYQTAARAGTMFWDQIGRSAKSLSAVWDLTDTTTLLRALAASWDQIARTARTVDARWDSYSTTAAGRSLSWDLLLSAIAGIDARWDQLGRAINAVDFKWDQAGILRTTLRADWDLLNSLTKNATLIWDKHAGIQAGRSFSWDQLGKLVTREEFSWLQSALAAAHLDARWSSVARTEKGLLVSFNNQDAPRFMPARVLIIPDERRLLVIQPE